MNSEDRLRRLLGGLDAAPGFEERVMQRVAALAAAAPREDLRAQFERRRELTHRRLRREAWMNGITILGLGACASALLWRYASEVHKLATESMALIDPVLLIGGTLAAVGAALWFLIRQSRG
jgi:hypothetical protein